MKLLMPLLSCIALALSTADCASNQAAVLTPEVSLGPGSTAAPARVLVAPPVCGSIESRCPEEYTASVRAIIDSGLEFRGYSVVPTDTLVASTRQRTEQSEETTRETTTRTSAVRWAVLPSASSSGTTEVERTRTKRVELIGSIFEDLPPADQRALMAEVGADGVITSRVIIGAKDGNWEPSQDVEVIVKLGVDYNSQLAWASRCTAASRDFETLARAVEQAARCAMGAAR